MSTGRITSAIFDMDGLLIDSEPLWLRGELEVFSQLGLNVHDDVPETWGCASIRSCGYGICASLGKAPASRWSASAFWIGYWSWCGRPARCCQASWARCSCVAPTTCTSG